MSCLPLFSPLSFFILFFSFWLHWVFVAARGLSLVAHGERELLFVMVRRLLIMVASLLAEHRL